MLFACPATACAFADSARSSTITLKNCSLTEIPYSVENQ